MEETKIDYECTGTCDLIQSFATSQNSVFHLNYIQRIWRSIKLMDLAKYQVLKFLAQLLVIYLCEYLVEHFKDLSFSSFAFLSSSIILAIETLIKPFSIIWNPIKPFISLMFSHMLNAFVSLILWLSKLTVVYKLIWKNLKLESLFQMLQLIWNSLQFSFTSLISIMLSPFWKLMKQLGMECMEPFKILFSIVKKPIQRIGNLLFKKAVDAIKKKMNIREFLGSTFQEILKGLKMVLASLMPPFIMAPIKAITSSIFGKEEDITDKTVLVTILLLLLALWFVTFTTSYLFKLALLLASYLGLSIQDILQDFVIAINKNNIEFGGKWWIPNVLHHEIGVWIAIYALTLFWLIKFLIFVGFCVHYLLHYGMPHRSKKIEIKSQHK